MTIDEEFTVDMSTQVLNVAAIFVLTLTLVAPLTGLVEVTARFGTEAAVQGVDPPLEPPPPPQPVRERLYMKRKKIIKPFLKYRIELFSIFILATGLGVRPRRYDALCCGGVPVRESVDRG